MKLKKQRAECPIEIYTALTYDLERFEWDENKRELNIQKHRIDFVEILDIFKDEKRIETQSLRKSEMRFTTVGCVNDFLAFVVFVNRGSKRRIISARKANIVERKLYEF